MKNKTRHYQNRDVQDVIELIGGRWRGAILASLCDKPKRFNELKRDLGSITPATLIKELKYLEMNKVILRKEEGPANSLIMYFITRHGLSLEPLVEQIVVWAQQHRNVVIRGELTGPVYSYKKELSQ